MRVRTAPWCLASIALCAGWGGAALATSFEPGPDPIVLEDDGQQTFPAWATDLTYGPGGTLMFEIEGVPDGLFLVPPTIQAASGALSFVPAPDAFGTASLTATLLLVAPNGDLLETSTPRAFQITVRPVNDPPLFTVDADFEVLNDGLPGVAVGWVDAIAPGPPNEAAQAVTFEVLVDEPGFFVAGPTVDAAGTLAFELDPYAHGLVSLTVTATDDGGTADGGVATSAPATVQVAVVHPCGQQVLGVDPIEPTGPEDGGPQLVEGFAASLFPYPEMIPPDAFTAAVTDPALFTSLPSIDAAGNLAYTTATDVIGATELTVAPIWAQGGYDGWCHAPVTVPLTIEPVNDPPTVLLGPDVTVAAGSSQQYLSAWASDIRPGPANEAGQQVSFQLTADPPALFAEGPTLTPNGTLSFAPSYTPGSATVTVVAVDDGGTDHGGVDTGAPQTFAVHLVDGLQLGGDVTVLEDAGPKEFAAWAGGLAPGTGFAVTTEPASLFVTPPAVAPNGTLSFEAVADAHGEALVTVTPSFVSGLTAPPETFTITILPVNDPPSFEPWADVEVEQAGPPVSFTAWATAISPGPPDEAEQAVTFSVACETPAAFAAPPAIDAAGALTVQATADFAGGVPCEVVAHDDGGTDYGGVDVSPPASLLIVVVPCDVCGPFFPPYLKLETAEDVALVLDLPAQWPARPVGAAYSIATQPSHGDLALAPPLVTYTPAPDFAGADVFELGVEAGGWSADWTVSVEVLPVNDPPVWVPPTPFELVEAVVDELLVVAVAATDVDDPELTRGAEGLPSGATFNTAAAEVRWTPGSHQVGAHQLTLLAWDDEFTIEQPVVINVTAAPKPPVEPDPEPGPEPDPEPTPELPADDGPAQPAADEGEVPLREPVACRCRGGAPVPPDVALVLALLWLLGWTVRRGGRAA